MKIMLEYLRLLVRLHTFKAHAKRLIGRIKHWQDEAERSLGEAEEELNAIRKDLAAISSTPAK